MIKRIQLFFLLLLLSVDFFAQIPADYYSSVKGKNKAELKTALYQIIKDHTQRSYSNLWTDFQTTDKRADGKVWDMYSSASNFTFGTDQDAGSGGAVEGNKYNREHSFPKSWFNGEVYPMYTDLFHLYPTDKLVNNKRNNYPFGETNGEIYRSSGDFSKLGQCTFPGYTGTVFEPNDEYKGDFARTYFYMATCYEDKIATWNYADDVMLNQTAYPCYKEWAINLLLKWSRQDPVSEKEKNRNEAVYGIQKNRNPFIDYPEFAEYIWGNKMSDVFTPTSIEESKLASASVFASEGGIRIFCPGEGVAYIYSIDGNLISSNKMEKNIFVPLSVHGIFIVKVLVNNKVLIRKIEL